MSNHIYLRKRYKYAGDIMQALLDLEWDLETATSFLDRIKDADVVEVKHGEWIASHEEFCECSLCKYPVYAAWNMTNFCPNCGAKMGGERRENGDK